MTDMLPVRLPWSAEAARELIYGGQDAAGVLVCLQALQEEFGYVHPEAIPLVATALNVSRADVYGVLTYYRDLRTTSPAAIEVRVCMGEACQAVGARRLLADAEQQVDAGCDVTTVFCVGNCALGPSALVNERLYGRVSQSSLDRAIARARADT